MFYQNLIDDIRKKTGDCIYHGPFSTLKIPRTHFSYLTIGELLGTYEYALQPYINKIISQKPASIIVVGANHGYYCAGFSYTIKPETLIAYEIEPHLQELAKEWWKENRLGNITMKGAATVAEFKNINIPVDFLFCDCEGEEINLLNPQEFAWQTKTTILAELHDFYKPGLLQIMVERFNATHNITIIQDDIAENMLNHTLLSAMSKWYPLAKRKVAKHPNHRWIIQNNRKIVTFGRFIYMERK
jgi:hypothetical protein